MYYKYIISYPLVLWLKLKIIEKHKAAIRNHLDLIPKIKVIRGKNYCYNESIYFQFMRDKHL